MQVIQGLSPVLQALLAACFTWAMTAAGSATVFIVTNVNQKILDAMLGFTSGVMISVSFFSLLIPALDMSNDISLPFWLPPAIGFVLGGVFLRITDRLLPHLHLGFPMEDVEGVKTKWKRNTLLVLAMTLHNIPEGLAIGVAFGAAAAGSLHADFSTALILTLGIGIQNFPEGMAVSVPLRCEGVSRRKSFMWGQVSAVVEPIGAVIGAAGVILMKPMLPYALGFAAGTMIFVVIEELIPEAQRNGNKDIVAIGFMIGFVIMMILDTSLG